MIPERNVSNHARIEAKIQAIENSFCAFALKNISIDSSFLFYRLDAQP